MMTPNPHHLIWIDLEMTGLDTLRDSILEVAIVVTDNDLNTIAEGPVLAIYQSDTVLAGMDSWCQKQHRESGLLKRVQTQGVSLSIAEQSCLAFVAEYVPAGVSPMCGSTICQDRRFLHRQMPQLEAYFHYKHIDVSTVKELALRWQPALASFTKQSKHLAMDDVKESIAELQYYRKHFFHLA